MIRVVETGHDHPDKEAPVTRSAVLDPGGVGGNPLNEGIDRGQRPIGKTLGQCPETETVVGVAGGDAGELVVDGPNADPLGEPSEHRISAVEPILHRGCGRLRCRKPLLADQARSAPNRPFEQEVWFFKANTPPDRLNALGGRDHPIEADDQEPTLDATIHAALEHWKRVGGKQVLGLRTELYAGFVDVTALHRLAGDDGLGGLKPETIRRLEQLGEELDGGDRKKSRIRADLKPITGTRLLREWQGVEHVVTVTTDGFEWQGRPYKSLSAIARAITGTRWNGWVFFGLKNHRGRT